MYEVCSFTVSSGNADSGAGWQSVFGAMIFAFAFVIKSYRSAPNALSAAELG